MKKRFTTRSICLLGVLAAITAILGIYATFRIGNQIKIPMKFITVFITGVIFGPIPSGIVAAIADILNSVLMPVGAPLPQITAVEFLCGAVFGVCFYKAKENKMYYLRAFICSIVQFAISMTIMSKILADVGYFGSFYAAMWVRMPSALIIFFLHMLVLCGGRKLVFRLKNYITKEEI